MNPSAEALAWALVHFVWQGAALALLAFLAMRWLRLPAEGRYLAGILTLAMMLASPVVTYVVLARDVTPKPITLTLAAAPGEAGTVTTSPVPDRLDTLDASASQAPRATLFLLAAWLFGVAVFSMRLAGGWVVARRMVTRGVRPVTPEIALLARRVAGRLALDRAVRIIESTAVTVPVMVGWLKPVVLLPAVAVSGLTPTQIEALIAHELAHVRRHDYLVNLLQAAVETLLFYHPAVWWVSKQVRAEREHCCDDLAVRVCDRLVYVSALSDLAAMGIPRTALAATGGSLLTRVKRILGAGDSAAATGDAWVPGLVALVVLGAIVPALGSSALTSTVAAPAARTDNVAVIEEAGTAPAPPQTASRPVEVAPETSPEPSTVFEMLLPQSAAGRDAQAIREQIEALLEQLRRFENERRFKLDRERLDVEQVRATLEMQQTLDASKEQLNRLHAERARLRQLVEQRLASKDELARMEERIQEVELVMMQAKEQRDARMLEQAALSKMYGGLLEQAHAGRRNPADQEANRVLMMELERQLAEVRRATEGQQAEKDRVAREYAKILEAYKHRMLDVQPEVIRETEARARAIGGASRQGRLMAETVPVEGASATIRTGDVLAVEISGESDLPRAYVVQEDGSVRLPILGSIKVVGLTAQQAGQAITKQLARVNSGASVQVILRRPRTEEPRQR